MVVIEMENGGVMEIELYPDIAPITVANFEKLVKEGFYDGLGFHRIIKGFMIQGGDPEGNGTGGPGYHIKGEFLSNGVKNDLKHERGVISMARAYDPDSAGSQFFIMHEDAPHLDGQYAAFGKLVSGYEVLDEIATTRTGFRDEPRYPQIMKRVYIKEENKGPEKKTEVENEEKNRELNSEEMSQVSGDWGEFSSSHYITDRCIACGSCIDECPIGAIYESGGYYHINDSMCVDCGTCYEICPVGAVARR